MAAGRNHFTRAGGDAYVFLPLPNQGAAAISIILVVGAVLVGLGMLLFVSANWEHMARITKIVFICGAMVSSYIGAWYCKYEPGTRPKLGSALLLLGTLIYGAGIWLISQIFNYDTTLEQGLFVWSRAAGVAVVTRSTAVVVLLALLVVGWNMAHCPLSFLSDARIPFLLPCLAQFAVSMIAASWVCARSRSRAAAFVLLIGGLL